MLTAVAACQQVAEGNFRIKIISCNIVPHYALTSVLIPKSLAELAVFSCLDPKIGVCLIK